MGVRFKSDLTKSTATLPGPDHYNSDPLKLKVKPPLYSMGIKLKTSLIKTDKVPGPGTYEGEAKVIKQKAPSFGFGKSKRQPIGKTCNTPGPGAYRL